MNAKSEPKPTKSTNTQPHCRWTIAGPVVLGLILSIPCLGLSFISDDFTFLQRASHFDLHQLVPDVQSAFFRPISRELYFTVLDKVGPNNPTLAHACNAVLLAVSIALIAGLAARLGGSRFGLVAGLFFAALGSLPLLVAWVSCSQDLFAMIFIGAALHAAWSGRTWLSALLAVAALLSKETAIFFLPGVLYLRTVRAGGMKHLVSGAVPYMVLITIWAAFHPKIRAFLLHGFASGEGGYVGLDNPYIGRNALRTAGALINIPPTWDKTPWPSHLTGVLLAAIAVVALLVWVARRCRQDPEETTHEKVILRLGLLLGLLPALLTIASAKHWFPYYVCMPAIGTSMLLALPFRRGRWPMLFTFAAAFLIVGVWFRGTDAGLVTLPAEANFRHASICYKKIEASFHRLRTQFPESARIYLCVEAPRKAGVHVLLMHAQAARTWYQNESIVALPAEFQDKSPWPRYLFWVTPACDVFEITVPELRVRSPGPKPSYASYQRALRSFALGAWASGDPDRAVALLQNLQEVNTRSWAFDRRLAAALLIASGRSSEASKLLEGLPRLSRGEALGAVTAALTPELPRPGLDDAVFQAFGLDTRDTDAYSELMLYFSDRVLLTKAKRMAERVLALAPGDEDATAMLNAIAKVPKWEAVMVPAEGWTNRFENTY